MKVYTIFDADGLPLAFYTSEIHGNDIPGESVRITESQWNEFLDNQGARKWRNGEVVEYSPPPPIPTVEDFRIATQSLIDAKAQEKQYDSGATLASYVNSTIEQWAVEATAFVAWRDAVWTYALAELDLIQSGARSQPTIEAFLAELPEMEWPE